MTSAAWDDPDEDPRGPVGPRAAPLDGPESSVGSGGQVGGFAAAMGWAVPGVTGLGKVPAVQDPQSTQDRDLLGSCDWGRPSGEVLQAPVREAVTDLVDLVDAAPARTATTTRSTTTAAPLQLHDGRWIGPAGFTDPPHRPPA